MTSAASDEETVESVPSHPRPGFTMIEYKDEGMVLHRQNIIHMTNARLTAVAGILLFAATIVVGRTILATEDVAVARVEVITRAIWRVGANPAWFIGRLSSRLGILPTLASEVEVVSHAPLSCRVLSCRQSYYLPLGLCHVGLGLIRVFVHEAHIERDVIPNLISPASSILAVPVRDFRSAVHNTTPHCTILNVSRHSLLHGQMCQRDQCPELHGRCKLPPCFTLHRLGKFSAPFLILLVFVTLLNAPHIHT